MGLILRWLISFLAVLVVARLTPWIDTTTEGAAIFAIILGLVNAFIKPIVSLLTLPFTIITLGLFSLVVNFLLFALAAAIVPNFSIPGGLLSLILASIAVSIVTSLISRLFGQR